MKETNKQNTIKRQVFEYKVMSQKGTVGFYEKAVFLDMITYLENHQESEQAIIACEDAFSQHVCSYEFLIRKSQLLLSLGVEAEAIECLEKALNYSPNDLEIKMALIEALIQGGREDDADFLLKEMVEEAGGDNAKAKIYQLQSEILEQKGDFEKMFFTLKKALKYGKFDDSTSLLNKVWFAVEMAGLHEESVEFHLAFIDEDPYSFLAWFNLGQAYFCLEQYKEAAEAFEYVNIIKKDFDLGYKDGAEAFLMLRNYEKALDCLTEYLEVADPDSEIYTKLGICHEHLKEIETAKIFYEKAIKLNPCNSLALFRLGECSVVMEDWETAISYYNQAIEMDCGKEEYLAALAEAYFKNKNILQAKEFFQRATEMAPELSQYWAKYALFLMALGDGEEAASILDEARIHAGGTELLYCKVACLFTMSKREEALQTLTEALEENVSLLESLFTFSPDLEEDNEVRQLVAAFRPK